MVLKISIEYMKEIFRKIQKYKNMNIVEKQKETKNKDKNKE